MCRAEILMKVSDPDSGGCVKKWFVYSTGPSAAQSLIHDKRQRQSAIRVGKDRIKHMADVIFPAPGPIRTF